MNQSRVTIRSLVPAAMMLLSTGLASVAATVQPAGAAAAPSTCVATAVRPTPIGYDLVVENRCDRAVNVSVCGTLRGRESPTDQRSIRLGSGRRYHFGFFEPEQQGFRYSTRDCAPDSTMQTNNCPAACP